MRSAALVLLLLCLCPVVRSGHSEASVPKEVVASPGLAVVWDDLRGLKELVLSLKAEDVDRRQALRSMDSRLRDAELQGRSLDGLQETVVQQREQLRVSELRTETDRKLLTELISDLKKNVEQQEEQGKVHARVVLALESRLNASESALDSLRKKNTGLAAELPFLQTRLRASERTVEQLRRENAELAVRLCSAETLMQELRNQISASNSSSPSETGVLVPQEEQETNSTDQMGGMFSVVSRLEVTERHLDELQTRASALEDNLSAVTSEQQLLEANSTVATESVRRLQLGLDSAVSHILQLQTDRAEVLNRLRVSAQHLDNLTTKQTEFEVRLNVSEEHLGHLKTEQRELTSRQRAAEDQLHQLETNVEGGVTVAFSAALSDSGPVGPYDQETTLIFSKTICNVGHAYNQSDGVFTTPVRGVYFFTFTAADYLKGYMGLHLYRNQQAVIFSLDLNDHGGYTSTSGGVALQLEAGDTVRLSLPASYRLYDDARNFSVFSGFLLFPL